MGEMDLLKLEAQNNFAQDLTFSSLDFSLILLTSFLCPTTLHCVSLRSIAGAEQQQNTKQRIDLAKLSYLSNRLTHRGVIPLILK